MKKKRGLFLKTEGCSIKFFFILFLTIMTLSWSCGQTKAHDPPQEKPPVKETKETEPVTENLPEITIRNVTENPVTYKIKSSSDDKEPQRKTIQVGEVHHYPSREDMYVFFPREDLWIRYTLEKGKPFSFRMDENNELELYIGSHGREDAVDLAPYVPTPLEVAETMLHMAGVNENDVVYDIGCGDGRIVVMAAKKLGAHGVGIELDPERLKEARLNAQKAGVEERVEFRQEDATKSDYSEATVVTMYLLPESNELLRPILEAQLKDGARVVSHNYDIIGWKDREIGYQTIEIWNGEEHSIYLYKK